MPRVIGVDACAKGWVGVADDLTAYFGRSIAELLHAADSDGRPEVVAIDIPIGLPTHGPRQADLIARRLVGKRSASVFTTPIRAALLTTSYAEANAINKQVAGQGISRQAFGLCMKILEVDDWIRATDRTVIEAHPEVSFATMAEHTLTHPKSTWAGAEERRRVLANAGISLPADIGIAGQFAAVDDVLDAAAISWTAHRHAAGTAVSYPDLPETYDAGPPAAIWA